MTEEPTKRPEFFEEANYATEIKLSILSRYVGYRPDGKGGGGFLNATVKAVGRSYIDGHASYGVDRIEGFNRRNGTPLIALDARVETKAGRLSQFTKLWFVEIDETRAEELRRRVNERGASARAKVIVGDINTKVAEIVPQIPTNHPALCTLDPYDPPGLHFETIRQIATAPGRRNKVELFVNLPVGLQHRQARDPDTRRLRPNVIGSLTRLIGNDSWLPVLEAWSQERVPWADAYEAMKQGFISELRALGYRFFCEVDVPPGKPMYALVFASDHPLAETIMTQAIRYWERDPANLQRTLMP